MPQLLSDLNTTAYPDRHYKNHLLDEVRKWKWLAQNALELSISVPNNNLSNVSTIQDTSIVSKMKSFIDEKPDLEEFMTANSKFVDRAAQHCKKLGEIHGRINTFCIEKDKLVLEISRDVREQILLDC